MRRKWGKGYMNDNDAGAKRRSICEGDVRDEEHDGAGEDKEE